MKPTFEQVKNFFLSWGLCPGSEVGEENEMLGLKDPPLGNSNYERVINAQCNDRMRVEAESLYGEEFRAFVSCSVEATDGAFYIGLETWEELEENWL